MNFLNIIYLCGVVMKKLLNKDLSILNDIKIAHRGLCNSKFPENSLDAFKECVDKLIPIELDIHILRDNTLVVIHDDNTMRITGKNIVLKNADYEDIKKLRLGGTNQKIPTLKDVLDLVNGKVLLDIELKVDVLDFRICHEICKYLDNYRGNFIVKSFNPFYIWWFRKHRLNYVRGLLISRLRGVNMSEFVKKVLFKMPFNFFARPDFIAFDYRDLPDKRIDNLYQSGIPILLFTINSDEKVDYEYTGFVYEGE